ncbi:MAG: hypothetical protein AAGA10_01615 [Bacteroidota bacterium]
MRIYLLCLCLYLSGFGKIQSLSAQAPQTDERRDGEIVYREKGQAFLAEYSVNCIAEKGDFGQNFGLRDSILINYPGQTGDESLKFNFSSLVFAEKAHQKDFHGELLVHKFEGLVPYPDQGPAGWDAENSGGAEVVRVQFTPENVLRASVSFELRILDRQNKLLGQAFFTRNIQIEREQIVSETPPEPTPQVPISTLSEDEIWNIFLAENMVESFEKYRIMFPDGKYRDIATKKILLLKEQNSWVSLSSRNTCSSYQDYLEIYPKGSFREEAITRMKKLGCDAEGQNSPPNDSQQYEDTGQDVASNEEVDLERVAYDAAIQVGTTKAFKEYLSAYPNGRFSRALIQKIPFEVLQQDHVQDSLFSVVFAYVVPPLSVLKIEVAPDELIFEKASQTASSSIVEGNTLFWPEGNFKSKINAIRGNIFRFEAALPTGKTYWVTFQDRSGQTLSLELDSKVRSMEIVKAAGLDATFDSLVVNVTGGLPPYYIRFVRRGEPFKNYEHEAELVKMESGFYLPKNEILDNTYLTGGIYDFYILDKRKSQYKKYHLPVIFSLDAGVNPYLWQILAPIILILIIALIVFYRRNAQNNTRRYPLSS